MQQPVMTENHVPQDKALYFNTKFGEVTLREDRLITFEAGLLGFNNCTTFGLSRLPGAEDSPVMLLQCVNEPDIAFLVADPSTLGVFINEKDKAEALKQTAMSKEDTQFLTILTMYDQDSSYYLTANMRAPLMVDSRSRQARQHILSNKNYSTQQKI